MTKHYTLAELTNLAIRYGFAIDASSSVPGRYASSLEDLLHMLFWRSGFAVVKSWWFFLFGYPVYVTLDLLDRRHEKGNYLIVRLKKT
jgi:hypothetical protein